MSLYKQVKQTFISEYKNKSDQLKERIIKWNTESPVIKINNPTNIARARELGYKAKEGIIVVRVKIRKGKRKRQQADGGRKPSKSGRFFSMQKSLQSISEERAAKKFSNYEVLNSYYVGQTGMEKFYEVILMDRNNPVLINDKIYSNIISQKNRVSRGLTSSGKKHRGLRA
ncbi:MAG: 50S ribosomal protein L15e [Candidatus Marsarchaeota archaeon]|nr:50S ribosomal protein L15e [Candidatus Marsarchaeota archaeon]MCL5094824.1 50S ribosomal protein L15e [Candidatus Marsarchaeota archaeon]